VPSTPLSDSDVPTRDDQRGTAAQRRRCAVGFDRSTSGWKRDHRNEDRERQRRRDLRDSVHGAGEREMLAGVAGFDHRPVQCSVTNRSEARVHAQSTGPILKPVGFLLP
jgi:hypothetical protein